MNKGKRDIFYKLNTRITAAIVMSLVAVLGFSTFVTEKIQKEEAIDKAKDAGAFISSTITRNIEYHMLKNDRFAITDFMESLSNSREIKSGSIVRNDGRIMFSTNPNSAGIKISPVFVSHFFKMAENQSVHLGFKSGERVLSVITKISNKNACHRCHDKSFPYLGVMIIDISMVSTDKLITNNRYRLVFSSIVAILAASLILYFLNSRYIYTPMKKLNRVIEGVKKGDLLIREDYPTKDEFGHLGDSLNVMVESLNEANNKLRESYRKQLYQSEKLSAIGLLTSGIIHEIQSPLTGIHLSLNTVRDNIQDQEMKNILEHILITIKKPMRMAGELLGFVKPSKPRTEEVDANELIQSVLLLIEKQAEKQRVLISREFGQELPLISVDPDSVRQVFLNLMLNAMQAMPSGGNIRILTGSCDAGETLFISFIDNGAGIPHDGVNQLFKPFFTTKKDGTGLGLYISKGIIDSYGGEIAVKTEPSKGSEFTIKLPVNRKNRGLSEKEREHKERV